MMTFLSFVPSLFPHRLANKLQPGAVKMNVTSKVSNPAMRANKEVGYCISFLQFSFNKLTTATNFDNLSCTPIGKKRYNYKQEIIKRIFYRALAVANNHKGLRNRVV